MTSIRRWPGIATCLTIIRPFPAKLAPEGGTERLRDHNQEFNELKTTPPGRIVVSSHLGACVREERSHWIGISYDRESVRGLNQRCVNS
jgi:hypothetical protein